MVNLKNRAEVECLVKARQQKLDLSETMVDIGRTVLMVADRASRVIDAYRHIRAGRFYSAALVLGLHKQQFARRGIKGNVRATAQAWLELQYGWKPLLNDIYNGIRAVNEGLAKDPNQTYVVRRVSEGLPFLERDVSYVWPSERFDHSAFCDVEVKYRFRVSDPYLAYLTGIGLDNPLYLAWVALPFSFVVDWLVPVSDWLSAMSAPLGLTFVSGYCSTKTHGTINIRRDRYSNENLPYIRPAIGRAEFVMLRRELYNSFPLPKLYFRFPFTSLERAASAVALFIVTNKGRT
jgi:hypothetical protein